MYQITGDRCVSPGWTPLLQPSPSASLILHGWTCAPCHSFAGGITHGRLGLSPGDEWSQRRQAQDQFCGSFHITFPGKDLAGKGFSTPPGVSLCCSTAAVSNSPIHTSRNGSLISSDLSWRECGPGDAQSVQEKEKVESAHEELHVICGCES